ADHEVVNAFGLELLLQRADRNVGALGERVIASLNLQPVPVGAVCLHHQGVNATLRIEDVVAMDVVENVEPVGVLETGEAEGLVEPAVPLDAEIGPEADAART